MAMQEVKKAAAQEAPDVEYLGPKKGYVEALDEALVQHDQKLQEKLRREKNPLRPSSAGECARKLAYMYREHLGLEAITIEPRKASVVRLLDIGHYIETHILRQFQKVDDLVIKYKQQVVGVVEYSDGELTEGSIDMGFQFTGESLGIGDAKSKGDKFSISHKSSWDETGDIYAEFESVTRISATFFWINDLDLFLKELKDPYFRANFYQLNSYIHSPFFQTRNADHGTIIQYNKNDSRMREFRFRPSRTVYEYVEHKFKHVKENAVDNIEAVPKEYIPGNVKCAYCPYSSKCWPGVDTQQEFYDTFPDKKWPKDTSRLGTIGEQLESLYETYEAASDMSTLADEVEQDICKLLDEQKILKVRFSDGCIYELKRLKSPRPAGRIVLRRSKL